MDDPYLEHSNLITVSYCVKKANFSIYSDNKALNYPIFRSYNDAEKLIYFGLTNFSNYMISCVVLIY